MYIYSGTGKNNKKWYQLVSYADGIDNNTGSPYTYRVSTFIPEVQALELAKFGIEIIEKK